MAEKKITFEDLARVNSEIKPQDIKGKDYAAVNERIKAFRKLYPNGTICTEIISLENGVVVFKASAMNEAGAILATGHAYEKEGSTFINKTSFIENAETSAVGRCLGMLGIGIDVSIASYEETANAIKQQEQQPTQEQPKQPTRSETRQKLKDFCIKYQIDQTDVVKACNLNKNSTDEDYEKAYNYAMDLLRKRVADLKTKEPEEEVAGQLPFEV